MSAAYVLDAVRAPFGRYGGGLAKVRPDDLGAHVVRALLDRSAVARARADRRRHLRRRQPGRRGQPQRRTDGLLLNGLAHPRARVDDQPPVRLEPRCGDAGEPRDRDRRRGRRARRRGRVDEPRAVDHAQARRAAFPAQQQELYSTHARLAHGQSEHARAVDDLARRRAPRSWPTSTRSRARRAGRVRASQPPKRAARRGRTASTASGWSRCRAPSSSATRTSAPTPRSRSWRKLKPAFVEDGTVTAGNSSPLNDGAGAVLLASEAGARRVGREPLARIVSRGRGRGRSGRVRDRARAGGRDRARARRDRLGRRRGRRAQRGVRVAVPGRHRGLARARPRQGEPERRRDRDRPSARARRASGSSGGLAHELRRRGGGYGVAALCIGVGQGLAVVLEA